jgi:hypothetical protein
MALWLWTAWIDWNFQAKEIDFYSVRWLHSHRLHGGLRAAFFLLRTASIAAQLPFAGDPGRAGVGR